MKARELLTSLEPLQRKKCFMDLPCCIVRVISPDGILVER